MDTHGRTFVDTNLTRYTLTYMTGCMKSDGVDLGGGGFRWGREYKDVIDVLYEITKIQLKIYKNK